MFDKLQCVANGEGSKVYEHDKLKFCRTIMDEQLRTEFNEWARAGKGESMERGHRPAGEHAIARMRVEPDSRVLDIGCGSGWATRLLADYAFNGRVTGIDISDEMVRVAREASQSYQNIAFEVTSAEQLPFAEDEFTHAFSMESLYYYRNIPKALSEIHRVMKEGGLFCAVMDLYWENQATHQWIDTLKVPVELLSVDDYRSLFIDAGFKNIRDERIIDPTPVPADYAGSSFKTREDFVAYREAGSLMITGEAAK
ncbi:MAG TPA: methyltransferase domain-containing protein [Pyrinomonadaceae bacterium]|jgi:ubiquinone/menaquinone biosynthesis C-methylase UbiE|nr:methyltransferase domain-containing protein [Pyrinomonadaceae bacterium]